MDIVKGEEAPYDYSKIVSQLKIKFPNFPKNLDFKKSADFVDYLVEKGLVAKAYPKGNTVLFIQPVKPLNEWVEIESDYDVDEELFYANPLGLPAVKFENWISFLDFLDKNKEIPRFMGKVLALQVDYEDSFWIEKNGVCYFTEAFDFSSISEIREVVNFDIEYEMISSEIFRDYDVLPLDIIDEFRELSGELNRREKDYYGFSLELKSHSPYENYTKIKDNGFSSIFEFINAQKLKIIKKSIYDVYYSGRYNNITSDSIADALEIEYSDGRDNVDQIALLGKLTAIYGGYETDKEFISGIKQGFLLFEDYQTATKGGFSSSEEYFDAIDKGFVVKKVYVKATDLGYEIFSDYEKGIKGGFKDSEEYYDAIQGDFINAKEYRAAKIEGFNYQDEYFTWLKERSDRLEEMKPNLLEILNTFKDDTYSIDKINGFLMASNPEISKQDLEYLLINDEDINKLGVYNENISVFVKGQISKVNESSEIDQIQDEVNKIVNNIKRSEVIVDGSNVAYEGTVKDDKGKATPKFSNILLMMSALQDRDKTYLIYVRPNLRYKIDEKEKFQKFIDRQIVSQTPAGEEDDEFIIKQALKTGAKIISNDKFRDWIENNPKYANQIKKIRSGFTINDGIVNLSSNFDDWFKKPKKK